MGTEKTAADFSFPLSEWECKQQPLRSRRSDHTDNNRLESNNACKPNQSDERGGVDEFYH